MTLHYDRAQSLLSNLVDEDTKLPPGTVMIVDDTADNLKLLDTFLSAEGFIVVQASNGMEALSMLGLAQPDVIFMDVVMPDLDGYEVTRRIRAMTELSYIPIVMLTSLQDNKSKVAAIQAGADELLTKPFSQAELLARARSLIKLRRYNLALIQAVEDNRYLNDLLLAENTRLAQELERTREAQLRLMPQAGPDYPGVGFAAHYKPALEVGGDYYDYVRLDEHRFVVVLGDAVGKGGAAVLAVAIIKSVLATQFAQVAGEPYLNFDPAELLSQINAVICGPLGSSQTEMTLFCGLINLQQRTIRYSNAGQTFPFLVRPGELYELKMSGLPIGLFEDALYSVRETTFNPGDRLVLYSDGINEALNIDNEEYGLDRLEQTIREAASLSPELLLNKVLVDLNQFCQDATDDQTLVVFGF